MIRRILLPVNAAGNWRHAVRYGAQVAAATGAELRLLHVSKPNDSPDKSAFAPAGVPCDPGITDPVMVVQGEPSEVIAGYANQISADMILMPTRGWGLLGQLLFGSNTMDLLRTTERPVWVAKPGSVRKAAPFECRRILCGVELGSSGHSVLKYAGRFAATYGAELLIVHVVPEISEAMLMVYGLDDSGEIELLPQAARAKVAAMARTINVPYEIEAVTGDVPAVLRQMAKRWRADVAIVGRGRRTNPWRLGTNIGSIIAQSPCPVIAYAEPPPPRRPARNNSVRVRLPYHEARPQLATAFSYG